MKRILLLLTVPGLLLGSACGQPSPEKLCKKFAKLEGKSKKGKKKSSKRKAKSHKRCIKDMKKLKKDKPKAYKCVVKCSKQDSYDTAMLCTLGCILKHTTKADREKDRKERKKEREKLCKVDWSGESLSEVSATADGEAFSLKLPKGLKKTVTAAKKSWPGSVSWREERGWCGPSFTVRINKYPPKSLDSIKTYGKTKKILLKKAVEGGFLSVTGEEGNKYIKVEVNLKNKAGKTLKLTMMQRSSKKLPGVFNKQRAWLEKVAGTFKVK